jgi:sphingolipid 8-(E)-desaturase
MALRPSRKDRVFSRGEIEALIANGRHIVIVDNRVLKVDAWLPYHPGGDKAIRHMVGRDATDEVHQYVLTSSPLGPPLLTASVQVSLGTDT